MSTKADNIRDPQSSLNMAAPDEPIFILRASDSIAPAIVRLWAAAADRIHSDDKINSAYMDAQAMEDWRESQPQPSKLANTRAID